jgi:hypothetical protein
MFRRRLAVVAMLLAFAVGAGYTLELDLHEPEQPHPIAFHVVPVGATGPAALPGYYQQPPTAPVNPLPRPPDYFGNGRA